MSTTATQCAGEELRHCSTQVSSSLASCGLGDGNQTPFMRTCGSSASCNGTSRHAWLLGPDLRPPWPTKRSGPLLGRLHKLPHVGQHTNQRSLTALRSATSWPRGAPLGTSPWSPSGVTRRAPRLGSVGAARSWPPVGLVAPLPSRFGAHVSHLFTAGFSATSLTLWRMFASKTASPSKLVVLAVIRLRLVVASLSHVVKGVGGSVEGLGCGVSGDGPPAAGCGGGGG